MSQSDVMIASLKNPAIVEARKLDQRKHRQQQNQFLVEGLQLLHMALDAAAVPVNVFFCPEQFAGQEAGVLLARFRRTAARVMAVSPAVMDALCEREAVQGIVATFRLFETPLQSLELSGLTLVLDRLQDPGNLGTLIRTADAVGAGAVILIEPCADPFDRKTVRGSMGSLFNLPLARTHDAPGLWMQLKGQGVRVVGADAHGGVEWGWGLWSGRVALVLGNEARGLSDDVIAGLDARACLPMRGRAESLNVAVAGGVLMYAWLRETQT